MSVHEYNEYKSHGGYGVIYNCDELVYCLQPFAGNIPAQTVIRKDPSWSSLLGHSTASRTDTDKAENSVSPRAPRGDFFDSWSTPSRI